MKKTRDEGEENHYEVGAIREEEKNERIESRDMKTECVSEEDG